VETGAYKGQSLIAPHNLMFTGEFYEIYCPLLVAESPVVERYIYLVFLGVELQ